MGRRRWSDRGWVWELSWPELSLGQLGMTSEEKEAVTVEKGQQERKQMMRKEWWLLSGNLGRKKQ